MMVNRLWQGHFGSGLCASVDNFGRSATGRRSPSCSIGSPLASSIRLVDQDA